MPEQIQMTDGYAAANATSVVIQTISEEMVHEVANLHLEAFNGYANTYLGSGYLTAFINWFRQADRAVTIAALDAKDSTVVGYALGAPVGYQRRMNRDLLFIAGSAVFMRPWLLLNSHFRQKVTQRLRSMSGASLVCASGPVIPEPTMSLVSIAVSSRVRGKKVGRRMLREFETRAYYRQMRSLQLSVYRDNIAARHLYEACGWRPLPGVLNENDEMRYFRILDLNQKV